MWDGVYSSETFLLMFSLCYIVNRASNISLLVAFPMLWGIRWSFIGSRMACFALDIFLLYSANCMASVGSAILVFMKFQISNSSKRFCTLHFHGTKLEAPSNWKPFNSDCKTFYWRMSTLFCWQRDTVRYILSLGSHTINPLGNFPINQVKNLSERFTNFAHFVHSYLEGILAH